MTEVSAAQWVLKSKKRLEIKKLLGQKNDTLAFQTMTAVDLPRD